MILLLIGTTVATWDEELVERLTGRFVIRYDLRDTGRSTTVDPDSPGYTLRDLVTNAVGVLDGLGIARAHVVGIATGGFIAQLLALDHPSRVASLVLVGTRPVAPGPVDDDLPEHSPAIMAYFGSAPPVDWTDRTSILDGAVAAARVFSGSPQFDAAEARIHAAGVLDRSGRSAPGVGAQRPAERGVLEAGLHATLARTAPGDHRTDIGGALRGRPVLPGGQCEGAGRGDPRRNPAGPRRGWRGAPQPGTRRGGHGGARAHGAVARWALDTARRADPSRIPTRSARLGLAGGPRGAGRGRLPRHRWRRCV